ncbi:MAG: S8 family serine peptidase [Candidatus Bipolaricaulota bacterium]|nr:S8 family serine peptidase [Candidatus Bipolaricaulota bacterium]
MIDALVDRPGRVIVAAAGNEGNRKIHVRGDIRTPTTWHLELEKGTASVRFWHSATATFTVSVRAPTGEEVIALPGGQRWSATASGGVWIDNTSLPDPLTLDRSIYLVLTDAAPGTTWAITLSPVLGGGRVDGWVEQASAAQFREGDTSSTISEPGNARQVITVGAYITKTRWTSVAGEQRAEGEVGALAPFSSRGPTRDGRIKPDLAAPGAWIASARSRLTSPASWLALPGGEYTMLLGSSMAAPHVAGAAALLLSLRPDLTGSEVRDALTRGARVDSAVGAAPNPAWGAGKLDVAQAVAHLGPGPAVERPTLVLLANPVSREARFRYSLPPEARWASLQVYDLAGRLLFRQALAPPAGEARWPLTTTDGRPVGSGLYLAVLVTDRGASAVVRVVVGR